MAKKLLYGGGIFVTIFLLFFVVLIGGGGHKAYEYKDGYMSGKMTLEEYEKLKDLVTGSTLGERMMSLAGKLTYESVDGTNCMRTVSIAMDPNDERYSWLGDGKVINCDTAVNLAKANNYYEAYGKRPDINDLHEGDILVYGYNQHHVAVVGPGGQLTLIQNGASHNTVYAKSDVDWNGEIVSGIIRKNKVTS